MKKWIKIAGLLLLALPIAVQAGDFTYTTNSDNTITITGYSGHGGDVTIPETINGLSVTSIGSSAFQSKSILTNVTIPNSVTFISSLAFYRCGLTSVVIPNSVTNIERGAFAACTNLGAITVDTPSSFYSSSDGVLFNADQTILCAYPAGKAGTFGNIPTNVTSIGDSAFWGCTKLISIPIPSNVTNIENYAFMGCLSLTNASIPASVVGIKSAPFAACTRLSEIIMDPLSSFYCSRDGVLFDKSQIKLIQYPAAKTGSCYNIPASVTDIESSAFHACTNLTTIVIPTSVNSIGYNSFYGCSFTSITIPSNVVSIGHQAFLNCSKLQDVYFMGVAPSIYSSAFNNATNVTVYYMPATSGWTNTFGGRPTALWRPRIQTANADLGVRTNGFGFGINWASDMTVVVEACTNLTEGIWVPVETNTLTGSSFQFSDPAWTNYPNRYYRVSMPQ